MGSRRDLGWYRGRTRAPRRGAADLLRQARVPRAMNEPKRRSVSERHATPGGPDRRSAPRYRAIAGRAWIGWKDGRDFRRAAAWFLDVSQGGALLAVDALPPAGCPVWVRLDRDGPSEWSEARVVWVL